MQAVESFHTLAHLFISLIGAILLLALWYNIRTRFRKKLEEEEPQVRVDKGLAFLSLALFMWVLSGLWQWFVKEDIPLGIGINILSTANNLFLLLALFHFYHAPGFIYNQSTNVRRFIVLIIGIALVSVSLHLWLPESVDPGGIQWKNFPDLLLSGFLSYLLIVSFLSAFNTRGLRIIGVISVSAVAIMFISQLPEVFHLFDDRFLIHLVRIIAKTALISIFLVLAAIWVIQLANTPSPGEIRLEFLDWSLIRLNIPSKNLHSRTVDFGSKTTQFKNLLKFSLRRKYGQGLEQSIQVGSGGEIKSQAYLSRIMDNLNDILALEADEKLERRDLFTFIGEGRYRLRILPDNIQIDSALEAEFKENK